MSAGKDKALWAFDFDGVVCDSCGESSVAAWKASSRYWPDLFAKKEIQEREDEIIHKMRIVRPVVETGYENIVQIRCLLKGVDPEDMLQNWHDILPKYMKEWNLDRQTLVKAFGDLRDEWMRDDIEGWIGKNEIYEGVLEPLKEALQMHECYIVTTKQERYALAILKKMANINFAEDHLISTTVSGIPKHNVLTKLQEKYKDIK